jgi:hypothetical protein
MFLFVRDNKTPSTLQVPRQLGSIERGMPRAQDQAESSGNVFSMYIQIKPYIALHCNVCPFTV